ncbi:hypothetical protein BC830DRAFT_81204 [Chytriomyces sp. MP71]|nr:hypothetical protein BC830DRAFT_81204 [Chytriomyces sp. MP71]
MKYEMGPRTKTPSVQTTSDTSVVRAGEVLVFDPTSKRWLPRLFVLRKRSVSLCKSGSGARFSSLSSCAIDTFVDVAVVRSESDGTETELLLKSTRCTAMPASAKCEWRLRVVAQSVTVKEGRSPSLMSPTSASVFRNSGKMSKEDAALEWLVAIQEAIEATLVSPSGRQGEVSKQATPLNVTTTASSKPSRSPRSPLSPSLRELPLSTSSHVSPVSPRSPSRPRREMGRQRKLSNSMLASMPSRVISPPPADSMRNRSISMLNASSNPRAAIATPPPKFHPIPISTYRKAEQDRSRSNSLPTINAPSRPPSPRAYPRKQSAPTILQPTPQTTTLTYEEFKRLFPDPPKSLRINTAAKDAKRRGFAGRSMSPASLAPVLESPSLDSDSVHSLPMTDLADDESDNESVATDLQFLNETTPMAFIYDHVEFSKRTSGIRAN